MMNKRMLIVAAAIAFSGNALAVSDAVIEKLAGRAQLQQQAVQVQKPLAALRQFESSQAKAGLESVKLVLEKPLFKPQGLDPKITTAALRAYRQQQ